MLIINTEVSDNVHTEVCNVMLAWKINVKECGSHHTSLSVLTNFGTSFKFVIISNIILVVSRK
jgi:hypothetical protein